LTIEQGETPVSYKYKPAIKKISVAWIMLPEWGL